MWKGPADCVWDQGKWNQQQPGHQKKKEKVGGQRNRTAPVGLRCLPESLGFGVWAENQHLPKRNSADLRALTLPPKPGHVL